MWMHRVSTVPYFKPLSLILHSIHSFSHAFLTNLPATLSLHTFVRPSVRPSCYLLTQLLQFDRSHPLIHALTLHHPFTHAAVSLSTCVLIRSPTCPSTHPVHTLSVRSKYVMESPNLSGLLSSKNF